MAIPVEWQDMNQIWRCAKYRQNNRPEIIMTDPYGNATVTFTKIGEIKENVGVRQ